MWTKLVKGLAYALLVMCCIGVIIVFIALIMEDQPGTAVAVLIAYPLMALLSVGTIMVILEISENIADCREYLRKISSGVTVSPPSVNLPEAASSVSNADSGSVWRCKCGKSNPNSSRTCKDCGYEK